MVADSGPRVRLFGPVGAGWIAAASVAMVLLFLVLGFPYEQLAEYLSWRAGRATGGPVAIERVRPTLTLSGPGLEARGVRAVIGGRTLLLERARLRPAWSLDWLRGRAALHTSIQGPGGNVDGVTVLGRGGGFTGSLEGVDLDALPLDALWPEAYFRGRVDAELDLRRGISGPEGRAEFEATAGSLAIPGLDAFVLDYERIVGALRFGDGAWATIDSLALEGPLIDAEVTGRAGDAQRLELAPLQLQIQLRAEPGIRSMLSSMGVRLGGDGSARVRVSGTLAQPIVR